MSPSLAAKLLRKLTCILAVLDRSRTPWDVDLPEFRLHPLTGALKEHYAISVSENGRMTFRWADGHAVDVDYRDCH